MVMSKQEHEALGKVREAIIDAAAEDVGMIGEMVEPTRAVVEAWNAFANTGVHSTSITDDDIEAKFD